VLTSSLARFTSAVREAKLESQERGIFFE
jgi:hypothetical protein